MRLPQMLLLLARFGGAIPEDGRSVAHQENVQIRLQFLCETEFKACFSAYLKI
jgi:hypothetical protein